MKRIFDSIVSTALVLSISLALPQTSFAREVKKEKTYLEKIGLFEKYDPLSLWNNNSKGSPYITHHLPHTTNHISH